jgi:glycosyltransferase involved in cell wall biosynthesis
MQEQLPLPTVSVIIPLYNKEKEVCRAIQSVLAQTFTDLEIVVVNDGSTDKGPDLVRALQDSRIKVINQDNAGVSAARNRGITESHGELIAFLDADDEWRPNFLETIMNLNLKFPHCRVFATSYLYCDDKHNCRSPVIKGLPDNFKEGVLQDYFNMAIKSDPPLWSSVVVIEKEAINSIGKFPLGVKIGEDLLTWARLAVKYDIAFSTNPCALFTIRLYINESNQRIPDMPDYVGRELALLIKEINPEKKNSFIQYIGLWHKMRASIYLQNGETRAAFNEIIKTIRFSKIDYKLIIMAIFTLLPNNFAKRISRTLYNFRKICTESKTFERK